MRRSLELLKIYLKVLGEYEKLTGRAFVTLQNCTWTSAKI